MRLHRDTTTHALFYPWNKWGLRDLLVNSLCNPVSEQVVFQSRSTLLRSSWDHTPPAADVFTLLNGSRDAQVSNCETKTLRTNWCGWQSPIRLHLPDKEIQLFSQKRHVCWLFLTLNTIFSIYNTFLNNIHTF